MRLMLFITLSLALSLQSAFSGALQNTQIETMNWKAQFQGTAWVGNQEFLLSLERSENGLNIHPLESSRVPFGSKVEEKFQLTLRSIYNPSFKRSIPLIAESKLAGDTWTRSFRSAPGSNYDVLLVLSEGHSLEGHIRFAPNLQAEKITIPVALLPAVNTL